MHADDQPEASTSRLGFTLRADPERVRRGEELRLNVSHVSGPRRRLELGVLCREWFEEQDANGFDGWVHKTVYRARTNAEPAVEHEATFVIPADAPFSYDGASVRYRWEAYASMPVRLRPDRRDALVFEVDP
jgi:hypothetical protein